MMEILHTTAAFVVAIALLVAVHEYGHFIVARKLGIRVEKFSIGFGPALYSWRGRDGEVEYVIAAIPLGGYVKMLGENPDEQGEDAKRELSEEERARAFDVQPVWKRAAVAFAGPMFNFLFAIVAYMFIGWMGQMVLPPVIGSVAPASVAEQAGLQEGDRVLRIGNTAVHSWQQLEESLKQAVGGGTTVEVDRGGAPVSIPVSLPKLDKDALLVNVSNEALGISPGITVHIDSVTAGSPAEVGGIQAGDQVLRVDNTAVQTVGDLIRYIQARPGQPVVLEVLRNETHLRLQVVPKAADGGVGRIGVRLVAQSASEPQLYRMGFAEGMTYGVTRTAEMTVLTLQVVGKMITTAISPENLGGPIAIAQLAGKTAEMGLVSFVTFLALISVNLAVLNLLPVPVLDGGHLFYLGLEKIRGRPLSPETMERTQIVGMALVVMLMVFAFYNDLMRLFRG
jgi:regulator of sigma E protease